MGTLVIESPLLAEVSHRLELREPNRAAIKSVILETSQHYDVEGKPAPYQCIVNSATGVGKTYVLAGLIEYLAGATRPVRNFMVVTPGRTILRKTIANFTRGDRKSLMGTLRSQPLLVTAENFNSPAIARSLGDTSITKVFVFTVQSLLHPKPGTSSTLHDFVEGLGGSLYKHLAGLDDLVIFADEHHCYLGPAFSRAIRSLTPELMVGLTATPEPKDKTPVVYVYPLAAAIADKLVKKPIIVGRRDDASDDRTKLADGLALLSRKELVLARYCAEQGLPMVNPVMLVIAKDIDEAAEYREILESSSFEGGAAIGATLLVHSGLTGDAKEDALAALDSVEHPASPVRVIISVGMLKEGWDVKNVYVIASMRASVSEVLTEQTLGRGMRLPFGKHTGIEFLDAVEVLAHERYSTLLAKKDVLNQAFVDHYSRAEERRGADGVLQVVRIEGDSNAIPVRPEAELSQLAIADLPAIDDVVSDDGFTLVDAATYTELTKRTVEQAERPVRPYIPLKEREKIVAPQLVAVRHDAASTLNEITKLSSFTGIGSALATANNQDLVRTVLDATRTGRDVSVDSRAAEDHVQATLFEVPLEESKQRLINRILASPGVPSRVQEVGAAKRIAEAVIEGMGDDAGAHLSAFYDRCVARVLAEVNAQMSAHKGVSYSDELNEVAIDVVRFSSREEISSREATFDKSRAFNSWKKNLYSHSWFDTSTERAAAILIDDGAAVIVWARLHRNEVPITWTNSGRRYNPDFVVIEEIAGQRVCWLVETKQNREMDSEEVQSKRKAALTWANTVNSLQSSAKWRYLLVSETDVEQAAGWEMLKGFGLA